MSKREQQLDHFQVRLLHVFFRKHSTKRVIWLRNGRICRDCYVLQTDQAVQSLLVFLDSLFAGSVSRKDIPPS